MFICSFVCNLLFCSLFFFWGGGWWWGISSPNINPLMLLTKKEQQKRAVNIIMQALTFRVDWNTLSIFRTLIVSSFLLKPQCYWHLLQAFLHSRFFHQIYNVKAKPCECCCTGCFNKQLPRIFKKKESKWIRRVKCLCNDR